MKLQRFFKGALCLLAASGLFIMFHGVKLQKEKWRIEKDAVWIARYLDSGHSAVSNLTSIAEAIRVDQNVRIDPNEWRSPRATQYSCDGIDPLLYNTNVVSGKVLVIMPDGFVTWVFNGSGLQKGKKTSANP